GDIHGCYDTLISLLETLNYQFIDDCYQHTSRKAIFVGDFIDRGPKQLEVIDCVKSMTDQGHALAVMGNHELNAIAYVTPDQKDGGFLRRHSERNQHHHQAFLDAVADKPEKYTEVINWFYTLPMWLELDNLRIIHACWDQVALRKIQQHYSGFPYLSKDLLIAASDSERWEYEALETLLKGKEIRLGDGHSFVDPGGIRRRYMRVRWWDATATTYRSAFMGPETALPHLSTDTIEEDHLVDYPATEKPLVIGHYWMMGTPEPLTSNIACVDYSIARSDGCLCAYQWDGEAVLSADKYITVPRLEP
ncbi:MAG: metallophosphoesterase, partial [Leucothrix sp.]